MVIYPLEDRMTVELDAPVETTKSGLLLPAGAAERPQEGIVIAMGPGKYDGNGQLIPMNIVVGDRILIGKHVGTDIKIGAVKLTMIRATDVMAVLKPEEPA